MERLRNRVSARRLAALAGILFFVLQIAAPDPNMGSESPSAATVQRFYEANEGALGLAFVMSGLAGASFLVFITALRDEAFARGATGGGAVDLIMGAAILIAGFQLAATALWVAPALTTGADPAVVGTWGVIASASRNLLVEATTFWRGLLLGAVALVALRHAVLPRWLGWTAGALAAAALLGPIGFVESPITPVGTMLGFGSYIAFHFWVLLAGVSLAWRTRSPAIDRSRPSSEPSTAARVG